MVTPALQGQLLALNGAVFVSMLGVGFIGPILPNYAKNIGASAILIGLLFGVFSLSRALASPMVGVMSDRHGRKQFLLAGLSGYALVGIGMALCSGPYSLLFFRALQGIFAAMIIPIASAIVLELAPRGFEGRALGSFNMSFMLGLGLGPIIGGVIFDYWGITANFLTMAAGGIISLLLIALLLKEDPRPKVNIKAPQSVFKDFAMLQDLGLLGLFICRASNSVGQGVFVAFLPVLCVDKNLTITEVGILLAVNTLVITLLQKPSGWITDHYSRLHLSVWGAAASALCKASFPFADSFNTFLALSIAEGIASGFALPPITALAADYGRRIGAGTGQVMGFLVMAMSLGFFAGPVAGGWIADLSNTANAFFICAGVALIGAMAPLFMRPPKEKADDPQ